MSGAEPALLAAVAPEIGAMLAPAAVTAAGGAAAATGAGAALTAAPGMLGAMAAPSALAATEGAGLLAGAAAPEAIGAMSYVTPSVMGEAALPTTELLGGMYTGATATPVPAWQTAAGHLGKAGKAYSAVNAGMGAGQPPPMQAPAPRPIFQGEAAPIAQQMPEQRNGHQFAQMLLEQRRRGMLS